MASSPPFTTLCDTAPTRRPCLAFPRPGGGPERRGRHPAAAFPCLFPMLELVEWCSSDPYARSSTPADSRFCAPWEELLS